MDSCLCKAYAIRCADSLMHGTDECVYNRTPNQTEASSYARDRGGAKVPPAPPATPAERLEPPAQEVRTAFEEARTAFEEARTAFEEAGGRSEEAKEVIFCFKTTVRAATATLRQQRPAQILCSSLGTFFLRGTCC